MHEFVLFSFFFLSSALLVAEFSIWTREAGAGGLSIAVEGPSKAEIAFEDRKDGSSGVSYIVQEPGERRDDSGCLRVAEVGTLYLPVVPLFFQPPVAVFFCVCVAVFG